MYGRSYKKCFYDLIQLFLDDSKLKNFITCFKGKLNIHVDVRINFDGSQPMLYVTLLMNLLVLFVMDE